MNCLQNKKLILIALLIIVCNIFCIGQLFAQKTVWLDELDLSAATQGFGTAQKNRSVDNKPITINGKTFNRGFGTHAESFLLILLEGKATSFTAFVGIDDEVAGRPSAVEFVVNGDGKKLWASGIMRVKDSARVCSVSLLGVKKLELIVTDGGNGNYYDHADWVDAKFETNASGALATFNPISNTPYMLTPKAPATPKINGTGIYGVRPGSPFQFLIPATGDRPMIFTAKGLPTGLKIDTKTGIITGRLIKAGTYVVTLGAKNAKGIAQKQLKIVGGNRIALTPPMGWNSWNCFADQVSADKVKRAANAMVKSGLINHGWTYINVDDFWENHRDSKDTTIRGKLRDEAGKIIPNSRFGNMKNLADYVHNKGLKVGLLEPEIS